DAEQVADPGVVVGGRCCGHEPSRGFGVKAAAGRADLTGAGDCTARRAGMVRRATTAWSAGLLLAAAGLPGCSPHFTRGLSPPTKPTPVLPLTARSPIEPDVSALPIDTTGLPPSRPAQYRRLTAAERRALAIKNASSVVDLDNQP